MKEEELYKEKATAACGDHMMCAERLKDYMHFESAVKHVRQEFVDPELLKKKASWLRQLAMFKLEKYLVDFEEVFKKSGGKVLWSLDAHDAVKQIKEVIALSGSNAVVHAHSSLLSEVDFPAALADEDVRVYADSDPQVRSLKAPVYIASADMLAADSGLVAKWQMSKDSEALAHKSGVFILLCGIESITPSVSDLSLFYTLYTGFSYPQKPDGHFRIFSGAFSQRHTPESAEFYIVFIDNGRSNILAKKELRESMHCIQCGACEVVCPVYWNIGKESYPGPYPAPLSAIVSPHLLGMKQYAHLSYASTLCGACAEICPIGIDLTHMLRVNREMIVKQGSEKLTQKAAYRIFGLSMQNRKRYEKIPVFLKQAYLSFLYRKSGLKSPRFAKESFSKSWIRMRD